MSVNLKKWVPAAVASLVVAAAAIAVPISANAAVSLPSKTPAQVLAMVGQSKVSAFSGTIKQTSNLGLPQLPGGSASSFSGGSASGSGSSSATVASVLSALAGSSTARVYVDGATNQRLQIMDNLAERDAIHHGSDVWLYDSKANTVQHSVLAPKTEKTPLRTTTMTPAQVADTLINKLDPTTKATVGTNLRVAGRTAYELVLTPKASDTLIGSVSIAVDSATGFPLSVEATARGQKAPAFQVAFSDVTFAKPAASTFAFVTPKNAKVTEKAAPALSPYAKAPGSGVKSQSKPTVVGTGWDAVVESPASANAQVVKLLANKQFAGLATAVTGGRVFHTSLLNVLITSDGRVVAGSVSTERLQAVATAP